MDGSLLREIAAHLETDGRFIDAVDLRRAAEVLDVAQAISDDACAESHSCAVSSTAQS